MEKKLKSWQGWLLFGGTMVVVFVVSLQITTHLTFRTYCPERHARNRTIPDGGTV